MRSPLAFTKISPLDSVSSRVFRRPIRRGTMGSPLAFTKISPLNSLAFRPPEEPLPSQLPIFPFSSFSGEICISWAITRQPCGPAIPTTVQLVSFSAGDGSASVSDGKQHWDHLEYYGVELGDRTEEGSCRIMMDPRVATYQVEDAGGNFVLSRDDPSSSVVKMKTESRISSNFI